MNNVAPINFGAVSFAVKQINQCMLKNGRAEVLCVQVDEQNNIVDAAMVPLHRALEGGFEPARMIGK